MAVLRPLMDAAEDKMKSLVPFATLGMCVGPTAFVPAWLVLGVLTLAFSGPLARGADFVVRYGGSRTYNINGVGDTPALTLVRGETYTFDVLAPFNHPFLIQSAGVSNNNIYNGIITYTVPVDPSNYFYICSVHGFGNTIFTLQPTNFRIRSLALGSNLVLKSTGPTNYDVAPEFKGDLSGTNWLALTVQTNSVGGGTNETVCGRPPGDNAFIRIKGVQR